MEAKCVIVLQSGNYLYYYLDRDHALRATNQLIVVATPSRSVRSQTTLLCPDAWTWCLPYTKEQDYQTLLDQMEKHHMVSNEEIEAIRRETAGYQMSKHILSYIEEILEKMKPLQIELQLQLQQQQTILQQEYSRRRNKVEQTKAQLGQISRCEQLIKDAKGSKSDNK